MFVNVGNNIVWEITQLDNPDKNKAILRTSNATKYPLTMDMKGYDEWYYDHLEDFYNRKITEEQARIIYTMQKFGQSNYEIIREGKIIFSSS